MPFGSVTAQPQLEVRNDRSNQTEIVSVTMAPRFHCTHDDQEADMRLASL